MEYAVGQHQHHWVYCACLPEHKYILLNIFGKGIKQISESDTVGLKISEWFWLPILVCAFLDGLNVGFKLGFEQDLKASSSTLIGCESTL